MEIYRRKSLWSIVSLLLALVSLLMACGNASAQNMGTANEQSTQKATQTTLPARHDPLIAIHMLNTSSGWALTGDHVVKTSDGGKTWRDASPRFSGLNNARAAFRGEQYAWIASVVGAQSNNLRVVRTGDGGQHWQETVLTDPQIGGVISLNFINEQEGWLEAAAYGGAGAGSVSAYIFHTTDSGQNWSKISGTEDQSGLPGGGHKSGIAFRDALAGWATGNEPSNRAWLYMTGDGGKTWRYQSLPNLPGATVTAASVFYRTTPPVLFGNFGLLPVYVQGNLPELGEVNSLILYRTHDGGKTWQTDFPRNPDALVNARLDNLYIADMYHAWGSDPNNGDMYATRDGGQHWEKVATHAGNFKALHFIDAVHGWAIDGVSLYRTNDSGRTWQKINYSIQG
jgi:photosystem II stability/assembly factor-like uncharacterized protein